jgi:hypothetical protein
MRCPLARIALSFASVVAFSCSNSQPAAPVAIALPTAPTSQTEAEAPEAAPITTRLDGGCEEAQKAYIAECNRDPSVCHHDPSQRTGGSYGEVLNRGTYLNACGAPQTMAVKICAAIREGRVIAVTVVTAPGDEAIGTCIGRAVQNMSFPATPWLDIASTTFEAQ